MYVGDIAKVLCGQTRSMADIYMGMGRNECHQCHAHLRTYVCMYWHTMYGYAASEGHQVRVPIIIRSRIVYIC